MDTHILSRYYRLTKPGIIYGNAIMSIAGYFYGANGTFEPSTFLAMLFGVCFVMAAACVTNNIFDRDIDATMARTKNRSLVNGEITPKKAYIFALLLLIAGSLLLGYGTNTVTLMLAIFGYVAYVGPYTYSKRHTVHSTLIGTLSGSTPPVIGYAAATGQLDITAALLFGVMVAWQMAHFYSIAIFRREDYAAAKLPILSVVKGVEVTRRHILFFVCLFTQLCVAMGLFGGASVLWVFIMVLAGLYWLALCLNYQVDTDAIKWARAQFGWSLQLLLILCVSLSLDSFWH